MNLRMTKQALKACQGLDAKQYRQVVSAILALLTNPELHDSQQLRGATRGERRVHVGEFRDSRRRETQRRRGLQNLATHVIKKGASAPFLLFAARSRVSAA
jgi:hypothetical protein